MKAVPVSLVIVMVFLTTPVYSQSCNSLSLHTFRVEEGVPTNTVDQIKENFAQVDSFFMEQFGRTVCAPITVRILAGPTGSQYGGCGWNKGRELLLSVGPNCPWGFSGITHEYFHTLQRELSKWWDQCCGTEEVPRYGPLWLAEGSAVVVAEKAAEWRSLRRYEQSRARWIGIGRGHTTIGNLRPLEVGAGIYRTGVPTYELAALAVDFLIKDRGLRSLTAYYELVASMRWREAFQNAFGKSIDDFYREFEAYRETL